MTAAQRLPGPPPEDVAAAIATALSAARLDGMACSQADHHGYRLEWDADHRVWRTYRPDGRETITGVLTDPLPDLHTTDPPLFPQRA